jgi:adenine-specific DNA-methyltransferase
VSKHNTQEPDRFDLRSHDIVNDKLALLLHFFPEARTEGGKIDFDLLKLSLGESVDAGKERYGMSWPGKADCFKTIQAPSLGTLRPCMEESTDFDASENLIIEGDNLEALKLLQKSYLGKVKMIYIDPPYNTGNDFIYPDNYSESLQTYLEYTGQVDAEGRKFGTNTEADGRFHSKWMNMMYPRLYLARNLLSDSGVIFISIDDTEHSNLRRLCDEVFGEENFRADIAWQKRYTRSNNTVDFTTTVEHVLVYAHSDPFLPNLLPRTEEADARYTNPDNDSRGPWKGASFLNPATPSQRPNLCYPIKNPKTGKVTEPTTNAWRRSKEEYERLAADNRLYWGADGTQPIPSIKMFLSEGRGLTPINFWAHDYAGNTDDGTKELAELLGEKVFDNPKPVMLIRRMLEHATDADSVVLDFFAGSGTTAQAVIEQNAHDGGNRKFVLIQLPEPTGRTDFPTIADITKERVRRVNKKLNGNNGGQLEFDGNKKQDLGFRVFKLAESNFTTWDAQVAHEPKALQDQLEFHVDHIRDERTSDDILYELLLKSGFPLTTPVEKQTLAGKTVYSVAGGALMICLERELTLELIRTIAEKKPERVVCLDEGFAGNDQLKANAVQTFKTKGVVKFQTV